MSFFSEYRQVTKWLQEKHQIVFYAESRHYYQYFRQLINDLLNNGHTIYYITSDDEDPLLRQSDTSLRVIYVKWMLGFLFSRLKANVLIMTMPDLGNFLFKKSPYVDTCIYMFHAAVSTHQQYRKDAFRNYDCIFCTGSYQEQEIRKTETLYLQKPKELIAYGYPLFDELSKKIVKTAEVKTILVAPSWYEGCIFDTCIEELMVQLSKLPYKVIFRSHPEYEKRKKKNFQKIQKLISASKMMSIDDMPDITDRLSVSDILITDRSGIAFEFAFGTGRPVLFIETSLKQTNPDWPEIQIEPLENSLRSEMGITLLPSELNKLGEKLALLENFTTGFSEKMQVLKKEIFFNSPDNYRRGVDFIAKKINKKE
jgi:hypothetical protein